MYSLPISNSLGLPIHDHAAFLLLSGLLHEDLDDKHDAIRGALEISPLLASWSVIQAHEHSGARLASFGAAARWLDAAILELVGDPAQLFMIVPPSPANRAALRKLTVTAVSAARHAQRFSHSLVGRSRDAFFLTMVCSTKRQLDTLAKLNGHSPLGAFALPWPSWLADFERSPTPSGTTHRHPLASSVHAALESESTANVAVSDEEQALWFRPYPEFQHLFPLMLKKLRRLESLEENFHSSLQTEKLASLAQFAYGASQEINNPLANISARAQTLLCGEPDPDRRKKLLAINDQAFRAYEMIADMMLFAKPPQLEVREISLNALLDRLRAELSESLSLHNVRLRFRSGGSEITLLADPIQVGVAFKAICINGLEAMNPGGELQIDVNFNEETRCAEVAVEDQGAGLSDLSQRHLFDPFYSGREAGRGLGFGLCKAWRIVDQHGGRIVVSSRPSQGTRFTVVLPIDGPQPTSAPPQPPRRANPHEQRSTEDASIPG